MRTFLLLWLTQSFSALGALVCLTARNNRHIRRLECRPEAAV